MAFCSRSIVSFSTPDTGRSSFIAGWRTGPDTVPSPAISSLSLPISRRTPSRIPTITASDRSAVRRISITTRLRIWSMADTAADSGTR